MEQLHKLQMKEQIVTAQKSANECYVQGCQVGPFGAKFQIFGPK